MTTFNTEVFGEKLEVTVDESPVLKPRKAQPGEYHIVNGVLVKAV